MKLIWFERNYPVPGGIAKRSEDLEQNGFTGTMYPYGIFIGDYFTRIARNINKDSNFKYIVAIRPYAISPQYLHMICSSLEKISSNRISINFLTGWIYENEKKFGGIISEINDYSSNVERSNFMIEYAKEFNKVSNTNFYISTTNEHVFNASSHYGFPMIVPYSWYKAGKFNITDQNITISVAPIIDKDVLPNNQDADFFTEKDFFNFLDECKKNNVNGIIFQESEPESEYKTISEAIKKYLNYKN